ncbi:hypothetical protein [Endozoicomonas sp. SCSIO W0465]|uniref:hypothetical protein n=1 Tax=Endozoicomonas sp. SCSIO W0465 TaxID=2918516 RepID=UPI0020760D89|nr:hypothetical protein [Endozoicomonas sp. SCSIO W0465]USE37886.1 hypothetical protein MJO57_06750 [Endozoicomonas sp. SCSIO W0465]
MASNNSVLNIVIRARDLAKGALQKITKSIRRVGNASDNTSEDLQQMGSVSKHTSADMKKMGKAGNQLNKSFTRLGNRIRNLVAASLSFYALKKSVQGVLETSDQFERLQIQMNAVMGSVAGGERATEWIKEFTKATPLQLDQVTEAFNTVSTALGQLRSTFEFTGNFIKVVFNTFTMSVKGFAAGILSVLAEIIYGWQKIFEVAGLVTLEEKFTSATNLMRDQAAAFKKEMMVDAKDIKDAMAGMYQSFETSSKTANANVRNDRKITWKMIQEEQNR